MLHRFNAVFSYILEEQFGLPINLECATTMRKQLFGKSRKKGIKPKQYVKEQIELRFDVSKWIVNNTKKTPDTRMQDAYDGLVAAFFS
jgi:hypothetical protein